MATLRTLTNTAERLERQTDELISKMKDKFESRSERWQRSRKGKEFNLDIHLLRNLRQALEDFNGQIYGEIQREEE